jgi:poly(3-hydroxybutyrate) depolymerase
MAHPDCVNAGEDCPVYVMFNQGTPLGTSATFRSRVRKPHRYGKGIVVGGGASADRDVMAELPRRILEDYAGADPNRVYALGNSRGAGAITSIFKDQESEYGSASDMYAAVAVFGGELKLPDDLTLDGGVHALVVNGQRDKEEAGDVAQLARLNGCSDPESPWRNVTSQDPLMSGGDGTDIASKRSFGECARGDVVAYRFRDEGHVLDYKKNFDPKVRAIYIAWDFFQGRSRAGGLRGEGSLCFEGE